jgi:molybdate transport system substrate-binding protein
MRMRTLLASVLLVAASSRPLAAQPPGDRGEIRVWSTRAIATVLAVVGPEFERLSGVRLNLVSGLPPDFEHRWAAGGRFDVLISGSATVDEWLRAGRLVGATRKDIARSGIGVAVRAGSPKPDLRSVAAFREAIVRAKSVAYLQVGSGLYLDSLFARLDLATAVRGKSIRPQGDSVALLVGQGRAELGLVVITQILTTPGVELAGPLPSTIQSYITFAAAVSPTTQAPDAARSLIRFLQGEASARIIREQGMVVPPS